jgi:hypothetical protein
MDPSPRVRVLARLMIAALGGCAASPADSEPTLDGDACDAACEAARCSVPGTHATIGALIADPACEEGFIGAGVYDETLAIERDLHLRGSGAVIDGGARGSVITVATGATVTLDELTVRNGNGARGGGVANHGALTLRGVRVEDNVAEAAGGGVYSDGPLLVLEDAVIADNAVIARPESAFTSFLGGGVATGAGVVVVTRGAILHNRLVVDLPGEAAAAGAGMLGAGGSVAFVGTRIADNVMTFRASNGIAVGGGLQINAPVVLSDVEIVGNSIDAEVTGPGDLRSGGGGALFGGATTLARATVTGNRVAVARSGAASEITVRGGGLLLGAATAGRIEDSTIARNLVDIDAALTARFVAGGGGIAADLREDAQWEIRRSTIADNRVEARVVQQTTSAAGGGGILARCTTACEVVVAQSTVSGNVVEASGRAVGGGIAITAGAFRVAVESSTISGNVVGGAGPGASGNGGGIHVDARATPAAQELILDLARSTVTTNATDRAVGTASGGLGFEVHPTAGGAITARLRDSIVAGNRGGSADCARAGRAAGLVMPGAFDLVGATLRTACGRALQSGDLEGVDPRLAPLAFNGGPTATHELVAGSPAIDAGNPAGCLPDQRARLPVGRCDLGAFEK